MMAWLPAQRSTMLNGGSSKLAVIALIGTFIVFIRGCYCDLKSAPASPCTWKLMPLLSDEDQAKQFAVENTAPVSNQALHMQRLLKVRDS
jgi:hypothetical protein